MNGYDNIILNQVVSDERIAISEVNRFGRLGQFDTTDYHSQNVHYHGGNSIPFKRSPPLWVYRILSKAFNTPVTVAIDYFDWTD